MKMNMNINFNMKQKFLFQNKFKIYFKIFKLLNSKNIKEDIILMILKLVILR